MLCFFNLHDWKTFAGMGQWAESRMARICWRCHSIEIMDAYGKFKRDASVKTFDDMLLKLKHNPSKRRLEIVK